MYNTSGSSDAAKRALWNDPCLAAQIRRIHRSALSVYDEALRPHGLTVAQLDLLMTIRMANGGIRAVQLARDLEMDKSTLSRNLERLRDRDLVATKVTETGEARIVATRAGSDITEAAAEAWHTAQQATRARIGLDGVAAIELLMRKFSTPQSRGGQ